MFVHPENLSNGGAGCHYLFVFPAHSILQITYRNNWPHKALRPHRVVFPPLLFSPLLYSQE